MTCIDRQCFESLRGGRFLLVICWWDFASLHVASWGGWITGNGNTWVQCLSLIMSFLYNWSYILQFFAAASVSLFPQGGKEMYMIMMFCAWQVSTKISAVSAYTSGWDKFYLTHGDYFPFKRWNPSLGGKMSVMWTPGFLEMKKPPGFSINNTL